MTTINALFELFEYMGGLAVFQGDVWTADAAHDDECPAIEEQSAIACTCEFPRILATRILDGHKVLITYENDPDGWGAASRAGAVRISSELLTRKKPSHN